MRERVRPPRRKLRWPFSFVAMSVRSMNNDKLEIKITKGRDGPSTLTCTRPDGTSTWTKVSEYFPVHDMTHFVVETTLRIPNAFYTLVLDGWNIEDFAVKGASSRIPPQANLVEALVGRLQR